MDQRHCHDAVCPPAARAVRIRGKSRAALRDPRIAKCHGDNPAVIFHETGTSQRGVSAALESDAALFVARWATENGRIGVLLDPRVSPLGLYSLAASLAHATDGAVVVAAPCWGFCHRIGRDHEAGNAAWFGMGAGLDELDLLLSSAVGIH